VTDTPDDNAPELDCDGDDITRRTIGPGESFPPASRPIAEEMLFALKPVVEAHAQYDASDGPVIFGALMLATASMLITGAPSPEMLHAATQYCQLVLVNSVRQALDGDVPIGPRQSRQ
jgi:hypothetical protein